MCSVVQCTRASQSIGGGPSIDVTLLMLSRHTQYARICRPHMGARAHAVTPTISGIGRVRVFCFMPFRSFVSFSVPKSHQIQRVAISIALEYGSCGFLLYQSMLARAHTHPTTSSYTMRLLRTGSWTTCIVRGLHAVACLCSEEQESRFLFARLQ